jgi:hypothetical protein
MEGVPSREVKDELIALSYRRDVLDHHRSMPPTATPIDVIVLIPEKGSVTSPHKETNHNKSGALFSVLVI